MKKPVIIIIALFICCQASAQTHSKRQKSYPITGDTNMVHFSFVNPDGQFNQDDIMGYVVPYKYVETVFQFNKLTTGVKLVPLSPILLGVKLKTKVTQVIDNQMSVFSKIYNSYNIYDNSDAGVVAMGINSNNVNDYRYHVVINDSDEIIHWSVPPLKNVWGSKKRYAYLGSFHLPGKQLLIEVVNIKNYSIRDGVVLNWGYRQMPFISGIAIDIPFSQVKLRPGWYNLFARKYRNGTNVPTDMSLPIGNTGDVHIYLAPHEQVPYEVRLKKNIDGKITNIQLQWWQLTDEFEIPANEFDRPGKYNLVISAITGINKTTKDLVDMPFTTYVPPVVKKPVTLKQALPYIIGIVILGGLWFGLYYRRNRLKLSKANQQRQTAGLKLRSIRAQLNPHFMYNSLTSIQNLVNKNDISGANRYLSIFAGLTRQVLDTGNEELISLDDEIKILENYLQMEQLRFNFSYKITIDQNISIENTEIPTMLLQPFVENAVKHGVSGLGDEGSISIKVDKKNNDLVFYIRDNGKGFAKEILTGKLASYGLKLSSERIALLNEVYKDQSFSLQIDAPLTGTTITIRLIRWL